MNTDSIVTDLTTFPLTLTLADGNRLNPWKQFATSKIILCALTILDFVQVPEAPRFILSTIGHAVHNMMNIEILYKTFKLTHAHHDNESITILHRVIFASALLSCGITIVIMKLNKMDEEKVGVSEEFEKLLKIALTTLVLGFSIITTSLANNDRYYSLKFNGRQIN